MKTFVVYSGAGLSAESGIPTFRDSNGLWENHKVEDVADPDGWARDPELVLRFYAQRFENVKKCEPNAAHKAIAALNECARVVNITQNIDDLLERAGCKEVWHLHGSISQRKCEKHRNISNLDGDTNFTCDWVSDQNEPVKLGDLCPKCGARARPNVVWFKEAVDIRHKELQVLIPETTVFIAIGTSVQIYPAAYIVSMFAGKPERRIFVDKNPPSLSSYEKLQGSAGEVMPKLVEELKEQYGLCPSPKRT